MQEIPNPVFPLAFKQLPQPLSSLEWQFLLCKAVQDIGGRIWLGGTGSPAEQPSGLLVTLSLHTPVSRTQKNRKRKPQCFLLRALSCSESDAFISCLPCGWELVAPHWCSPFRQSKDISNQQRLPRAEVWHSPQHQPSGYCWTFQPKLPQTPAKGLESVSVGPVPGKQSRSSLAKNPQIKFCSAINWCWTVVVWTLECELWKLDLNGWDERGAFQVCLVLSRWFPPAPAPPCYFGASSVIVFVLWLCNWLDLCHESLYSI